MRTINATFDDATFDLFKKQKDEMEMNWENFLLYLLRGGIPSKRKGKQIFR